MLCNFYKVPYRQTDRATTRGPIGPKNDAKVPYFEADLGVGSRFGRYAGKKGRNPKFFFPQNRDFAGLMMGQK